MDIKDFILIGGGILIAMVVSHGFWIAWRAKREPLRLDIVPDLIPDEVDELERLRGELPNGGARVVTPRKKPVQQSLLDTQPRHEGTGEQQEALDLTVPPVLMEPAEPAELGLSQRFKRPAKPKVHQAPARRVDPREPEVPTVAANAEVPAEPEASSAPEASSTAAVNVREVTLPRERAAEVRATKTATEPVDGTSESAPVEELLVINLLAPRGRKFSGEDIVSSLRKQGLRYGDMNIFHRIEPATKAKLYSVANLVEPGTFDLADLDAVCSPGMSFFLQLPGPEEGRLAFADMLEAARNVATDLGGELRDEQLNRLTGQTAEHMRQRIADFARRRLSKRA